MNNNVVQLKEYSVAEDIQYFINGLETENTRKKYSDNIKLFIEWRWNKPIEFVTVDDVNKLTYTDFKKFKDSMRRKYAPGSVNNMLTSLYSLLKELKKVQNENTNEYVYEIEDMDRLRVKMFRNKNVNHSGYLTWSETDDWITFLDENEIAGKDKKIAYLKLARLTGLRKESMCNLTYGDIRKVDDVYVVNSYLKTKKHTISIPDEMAEMLFSLKKTGDTNKSKIFFSTKSAERLLNFIKDKFEISEERNINLHSLRSLAAWEIYCGTKDILSVKEVLNHDSLETSHGYIEKRKALEVAPTLIVGKEMSAEMVKDIKKDQWGEIFKNMNRSTQYEVLSIIKELGYSQE